MKRTLSILSALLCAAASAAELEPTLGRKGQLLREETFNAGTLPEGWTIKAGEVRVADGALRATQTRETGRLCLFHCDLPMQDAVIQIDFKFDGARGLNISANPAPGEIKKKGHLFSVMITQAMWNITEHNDKSDRASQSKALAVERESFPQGRWFTLLVEFKGDTVVAQVEGRKPLRASSKEFAAKKPGIEFRVAGRDSGDVVFDNLRVWELQ